MLSTHDLIRLYYTTKSHGDGIRRHRAPSRALTFEETPDSGVGGYYVGQKGGWQMEEEGKCKYV